MDCRIPKEHLVLDTLENYCVDLKERRIYLSGSIEEGVVDSIVQHIHMLNSSHHFGVEFEDPIQLIINSLGGSDEYMYYLYDAIIASNAPVITIGSGMVCSAATLILVSGDRRYATDNCFMMCHKGKAVLSGDDDEIQSQAELNAKLADRYWKLLERHTNKTALQWYRKSKNEGELWLDSNGMLKWGVIDAILSPERREFSPLSTRKLSKLVKDLERQEEEDE